MSRDLHATTQQLIQEIEQKDRRFRFAQSVFMVLIIMGFVAGGWFAAQAYQSEQKKRDEANKAVIDAINTQLDDQSKQLKCVVQFFTVRDRDELVIKSVDDCFATEQAQNGSAVPLAVEGEQGSNFTLGPSGPPLAFNPDQPTPGLEPISPQQPDPTPTPPQEPEPVEILGVPLCIPLTNVCVRQ